MEERAKTIDLPTVYKEHWLHIRHIENQRLIFASIYLAAYGVGLGSLLRGSVENVFFASVVMVFLIAFSYIGYALSVKIMISFWVHYREIQRLQKELDPDSFSSYEREQESIEQYILAEEKDFQALNKVLLSTSKLGAVSLPLTVLFPALYALGGAVALILLGAFNVFPELL